MPLSAYTFGGHRTTHSNSLDSLYGRNRYNGLEIFNTGRGMDGMHSVSWRAGRTVPSTAVSLLAIHHAQRGTYINIDVFVL